MISFYKVTGVFFLSCFMVFSVNAQTALKNDSKVKIYGVVRDAFTGEALADVSIYFASLGEGTRTNEMGKYEFRVPKGTFVIKFSRVDLEERSQLLDITKDTELNMDMKNKIFTFDEVIISTDSANAFVRNLDVGKNTLDIKKLTALPTFLGEPDVIRSLMLLPGVNTVGEGASGFNVRGGSVDQNLILQDGGLIFNSSHVFGFFSSFNPAIVKSATLYKSGLPAKYGGRLSSVLDVDLREGNMQDYKFSGGVGLVSGKLAIEGPILKNKLSFIVAGRVSYSDWLLKLAKNPDVKNSSAAFQDVNAKLTYLINPNNKLVYSGYLSHDNFALASDTVFTWQTVNHMVEWIHQFNSRLVLNVDAGIGSYTYDIEDTQGINSFNVNSVINYKTLKADFNYNLTTTNKLNVGVEGYYYEFNPGHQKPLTDESGVESIKLEEEQSAEMSAYVEDEIEINSWLSVRGGIRYTSFFNFGPGTDYLYSEGSKRIETITDTVSYDKGEVIASYGGFEPRINMNVKLGKNNSLKASYNRTRQYLHLITNTASITPTDLWKTSNKYIEPETANQWSLGYFHNFFENTLEFSVEGYYKNADNIVDFKDGTKLLMNQNIEADLINGVSEAYGVEVFANKKSGRFTGWMSYTYARIFRTVDGKYEDERINLGNKYPANNDKPHTLAVTANFKANPIVEYAANFTYSTGRPQTVPLSIYDLENQTSIFNFSQRNEGRIPDYHRLDISMTVHSKPKIDRKWKMSWAFAIYNVYGRKNAYSVFYENQYGSPPKAYKLSVFGDAFA